MPGNEVTDKLQNFFDEDNSNHSHQPQIGVHLQPTLIHSPWAGTQGQNGMPLNSNSNNSSAQSFDYERENDMQSLQMPYGSNLNQFTLKSEFAKNHPKNQQLALNGFMHGSQGFQAKSKQEAFQEDGIVSDNHSSMSGNMATLKPQQVNTPEYDYKPIRNHNFDSLHGQQQLMSNQQAVLAHPTQHLGHSDMKLLQQHFLYNNNLQELQIKQQLQQPDQGVHQQNLYIHKQFQDLQRQQQIQQPEQGFSVPLNGVPINDTNSFIRGKSKMLPMNYQMRAAANANVNRAQSGGSPSVHDYSNIPTFLNEGKAIQSLGFLQDQNDSSTPISSFRGSSTQHYHFQGMPADCSDTMAKTCGNQSYQGKTSFGNASMESSNNGVKSGKFQQANHLEQNVQSQELQGREEKADFSHNFQENVAPQTSASRGMATLDPTEEKLLFGTGDDSFGSWSALMEDAVHGSSDKGFREGNYSSFEKMGPSTGGQFASLNYNDKQQPTWENADSSQNSHIAQNFNHPTNAAYKQNNEVLIDAFMPMSSVTGHSNKPNGLTANESLEPTAGNTLKMHDSDTLLNDAKRIVHVERDYNDSMRRTRGNPVRLSEQEMNQQEFTRQQVYFGKHVTTDSSLIAKGDESVTEYKHVESGGPHARECGDSNLDHSHIGQQIDTGNVKRENSLLTESNPPPLVSASEKFSCLAGRQTLMLRRFQYHPMGDVGMDTEHEDSPRYIGQEQFATEKGQIDLRRNIKEAEETQPKGPITNSQQNNSTGQMCQNMLESFHNMDDSNIINRLGSSDHKTESEIPEAAASDLSASHPHPQHHNSSSLQAFRSRLAPPSQGQPASDESLPSQSSLCDFNRWQLHPLSAAHETSQNDCWDDKANRHNAKDIPHSNSQGKPVSSEPRQVMDQSANHFYVRQVEVNAHVKHTSFIRKVHDPRDRSVAEKNIHSSLSNVTVGLPPFMHPSYANNHLPLSKFLSPDVSQQLPLVETKSIPQPSGGSDMPKKDGFSSKGHNVWKDVSAQQRPSGIQPQKPLPCITHSMGRGTNSWALQMDDDGSDKGGSASSSINTFSSNSQQFLDREGNLIKDNFSQRKPPERFDVTPKEGGTSHLVDGKSSNTVSSSTFLYQQDANKGRYGHDSSNARTEHILAPDLVTSNSGISLYGRTMKPLEAQLHNFSLLPQMQAMKGADSDSNKNVGERPNEMDLRSDTQPDSMVGHRFIHGQNAVFRFPVDDKGAATSHSSFPSDLKMLSFSSRENEEHNANTSSQLVGREVSSQDMYTQSLGVGINSNFTGGNKYPQVSPQMAPSWFERYGTSKDEIPGLHDVQSNTKSEIQQYPFEKGHEFADNRAVVDQRTAIEQDESLSQSQTTSSTSMDANETTYPLDNADHSIVLRPKKRKRGTSELLSWYEVVAQGSDMLQNIRRTELDWSKALNRLPEKVEDEAETIEDGLSLPRSRRRLILTSQLIQQLLPPVPSVMLATEGTSAYGSVMHVVAKAALGDACSLLSHSRSNISVQLDGANITSDKMKTSNKEGGHSWSVAAEGFIGRSRKLQIDLSSLEKRPSMLDIRVECQELERFSIINRLGKIHGCANNSSRIFPERYVTAISMPSILPEGLPCLSL